MNIVKSFLVAALFVMAWGLAAGCADDAVDAVDAIDVEDADDADDIGDAGDVGEQPEILYWAPMPELAVEGGLYDAVPTVFSRISSYTTTNSGSSPDDPSFLGASGVGNGLVFALFGYGNPTNSMHSFAGPGYDIDDGFFGDYSLHLASPDSGDIAPFDTERVGRSLSAPVVVTRGTVGGLELHTVDFVPWFSGEVVAGSDMDLLRHCVIRDVVVRNVGSSASSDVSVLLKAWGTVTSPADGVFLEERETRMLVTRAAGGQGTVEGRKIRYDFGVIQPGQEVALVLTHCAYAKGDIPALPVVDVVGLLEQTAAAYQAWESNLADVVTPDPMVNDFIDGMKMTLKVQTSESGATCPMSEYTRTWARDNMGPVLAMLSLGGFEDVEGYLDYVYYAILKEGDLKNSYSAVLDIDWDSVNEPDWASMPALGAGETGKKRVAAETPSYMVLMYGLHNRFTGSVDRIVERQGLLHRCLFAQGFGEGDMLPFTGDETFRAAMNASFGLQLEEPHETTNWSGNSAALWLGAAREYERFSSVAGLDAEAAAATTRFAEVEDSTLTAYTRPDNCFAAFVAMDDMTRSEPFDDVSLQVTWSGWKDGDDPYAQHAFQCLYDRVKTVPGEICSPMSQRWGGTFRNAWKGVYTGMLPGYTLHAMTELGHPDSAAAFNMVRQSLSTSGNLQEYMILDDHAGLTLMYNTDGIVEPADYTAKFRPWEGGIVLDAVMQYLFGFEPDANVRTIDLRPHLPNNWPSMSAAGLRAADERFDVEVSGGAGRGHRISIRSRSTDGGPWTVTVRWDVVSGDESAFSGASVDGVAVAGESIRSIEGLFGQASFILPDITLNPGAAVTISIDD